MSLTSRTEYQEALSFADRSRKKCLWIELFLSPIVFISVGGTFVEILQRSRKEKKRERGSTRKGVIYF